MNLTKLLVAELYALGISSSNNVNRSLTSVSFTCSRSDIFKKSSLSANKKYVTKFEFNADLFSLFVITEKQNILNIPLHPPFSLVKYDRSNPKLKYLRNIHIYIRHNFIIF